MVSSNKERFGVQPARYQIKVSGRLRESWSGWLNGMDISTENDNQDSQVTTLIGLVKDQAALRGILCKIWDLNLTILSVLRLEAGVEKKESG